MSSIVEGYNYDIFISYRQKDNKGDRWVSEFVEALMTELESTFKEEISVYFDINPHDGLLETHDVDESLKDKLKCLIFIPIISRTYCDPKSFAWEHEFKAFIKQASEDQFGLKVKLPNGNVANRVLPVQIHYLDDGDKKLVEDELGGHFRGIEFIYKEAGIDKPLASDDDEKKNLNNTKYRIQIIRVTHAIKEIIQGMKFEPNSENIGVAKIREAIVDTKDTGKIKALSGEINLKQKSKKWLIISLFFVLCIAGTYAIFKTVQGSKRSNDIDKLEKSVAILPFVDLSPNHDKEYFSDGIMVEIQAHLYKIGDLKVTSSTSSIQYKGETNKSVKEIAKELGVANILEGSVRIYNNTVRISVQLIKAESDMQLWAEDYDRNFSDIFSIQSEVAQQVAEALKAKISPETKRLIDLKPTNNPHAYDLYLRAMDLSTVKTIAAFVNASDKSKAIKLFQKAIELDPNFSLAYTQIGFSLMQGCNYLATSNDSLNPEKIWKIAKPYFEKAILLDPDNGEAHRLFAWTLLWYECNFRDSEKEYKETQRIYPNYSWTDYLVALGQFDEAYSGAIKNVDFDSTNSVAWAGMIISSYFSNNEPETIIRKALTTHSIRDNIYVRSESCRVYMYLKEYDEAISMSRQIRKDMPGIDSPRLSAIEAISYFKTNRSAETDKIINKLIQKSLVNTAGSPCFHLAMIYAQMGEINTSFKWLTKAYITHEVEVYWLKVEPAFEPLHSDPKWKDIISKIDYPK
jgi:TolB-like protein